MPITDHRSPIAFALLPVINYQRRRQTIIVCGEFPKRVREQQNVAWFAVCGISFSCALLVLFSSLFFFFLGRKNIIFAVVSFGNLYEIFGISLTFAIYVHKSQSSLRWVLSVPSPPYPSLSAGMPLTKL